MPPPIYISGAVRPDLPAMVTPNMGNLVGPDQVWAADNGRFSAPAKYSDTKYLDWLTGRMLPFRGNCLFATAPDVVGDAAATLAMSLPMLPRIREAGYKAALVAQDGLERLDIPWDEFDALFIGGSTDWKVSEYARIICIEAKARGKWVHMGRVNSLRRMEVAYAFGCDSVDGTYLCFGPDVNRPKLQRWLDTLDAQRSLWTL